MRKQDVERVARYNEQRQQEYLKTELPLLLTDDATSDETTRAVLVYLQPWSNAFQRMISARVVYETDPQLWALAQEHQEEEIGHNKLLASTHEEDEEVVWDPVIEAGASWFVEQFANNPGIPRVVLAHLALEGGSLVFSQAASKSFPDNPYFELHATCDVEHMEMGYELLRQRDDWTVDGVITLLERAWQVMTVVSDHIAECARRDAGALVA